MSLAGRRAGEQGHLLARQPEVVGPERHAPLGGRAAQRLHVLAPQALRLRGRRAGQRPELRREHARLEHPAVEPQARAQVGQEGSASPGALSSRHSATAKKPASSASGSEVVGGMTVQRRAASSRAPPWTSRRRVHGARTPAGVLLADGWQRASRAFSSCCAARRASRRGWSGSSHSASGVPGPAGPAGGDARVVAGEERRDERVGPGRAATGREAGAGHLGHGPHQLVGLVVEADGGGTARKRPGSRCAAAKASQSARSCG